MGSVARAADVFENSAVEGIRGLRERGISPDADAAD
jgi:hypothetical protein